LKWKELENWNQHNPNQKNLIAASNNKGYWLLTQSNCFPRAQIMYKTVIGKKDQTTTKMFNKLAGRYEIESTGGHT
jgi:hypothetical protein